MCCSVYGDVVSWLCERMSGNELGAEGGAAVAEAMKSCKQLTSVNLRGMSCLCAVCEAAVCACHSCSLVVATVL